MRKTVVLVVDDDAGVLKLVSTGLGQRGYEVVLAGDGTEGLRLAADRTPDLVILDIVMPGIDGFEVVHQVRQRSGVPIIMLSARSDEEDKVKSLRLGADDYISKPFGMEELVARVEAVLRRTKDADTPLSGPGLVAGEMGIDFAQRRVTIGGREVRLTPTEYALLRELAQHRGKVLTHSMLLNRVWGPEYADEREYLRVFVNRLRQKIGDDPQHPLYISTEPGIGYRFLAPDQAVGLEH
ncbi:MAG: response regulator transcription factor [Chloroflexi bacterium]|nr:response regulator transcription factor [Chloroflexota bacterium]